MSRLGHVFNLIFLALIAISAKHGIWVVVRCVIYYRFNPLTTSFYFLNICECAKKNRPQTVTRRELNI